MLVKDILILTACQGYGFKPILKKTMYNKKDIEKYKKDLFFDKKTGKYVKFITLNFYKKNQSLFSNCDDVRFLK